MDVIEDIISEQEVFDMPEETLTLFSKLFNVNMTTSVEQYLCSPDARPEVVEKLNMCLGDAVLQTTFHLQVKDRNIRAMLIHNNMKDLPQLVYGHDIDVSEFIDQLTWLAENERNIRATLPARSSNLYKEALAAVTNFQKDRRFEHEHDLPALMKMYKQSLFCPAHEKPQNTGMRGLAMNKTRWKMQLKAAQYLKYCIENGISYDIAREC